MEGVVDAQDVLDSKFLNLLTASRSQNLRHPSLRDYLVNRSLRSLNE